MGNTLLEKQIETYKNKIQIMEHALSASAGAYYNINITKNIVPGTMYQVIDEVEYLGKPMVAEQHVVMYSDMVNGDLLAITYVLDLTKIEELHIKEMEHRKILEDDIK
ncbi:MAG: hypothetical protein J6A11_11290 [Lachnospiraceae bacterium]|nr:hypothetical protein [Lachnospiraceae bacterium]